MAKRIIDEDGFEWQVVGQTSTERRVKDRDGTEWTIPQERAVVVTETRTATAADPGSDAR